MDNSTQEKVKELADLFCSSIRLESERLYRSGMIDPLHFDRDQYVLAKVLLTASIKRLQNDFYPYHSEVFNKLVKNLEKA